MLRLALSEHVRYDRVMNARRTPVSRRDRPAKRPLSRGELVEVALRVMREDGLERVTMRRLALELDTGPASLYVYVRNTAELHGAMLDELVADLPQPTSPDVEGWREQLIELMSDYTRLLYAHPSLARSVLMLRPSGPHYLRLIDLVIGLLLAGGLSTRQAAWGVDLLLQHATATAAEQGSRDEAAEAEGEEEDLASAIAVATEATYPHLVQVRGEIFSGTGEERLRWTFSTLINGLDASPRP